MTVRSVHWHEGMFLRPHHFQAAQRHFLHLANLGEKWDLNYNWGLHAVALDRDALANNRLVVRAVQARFHDGTLISIPEDGALPVLDLKKGFEQGEKVMILLAVPLAALGKANAS